MKHYYKLLLILFLVIPTSSFAQYVNYEVKLVLDSVKSVKGTLQKVSAEGIAITDAQQQYLIFKSKNIVKVKVRRKGLTVIQGLGTGSAIGLGIGTAIFLSNDHLDKLGERLAITGIFTGVGAIGGTLGGLIGEALNTVIILNINGNTDKYKKLYPKLEKYSKAYFTEKPIIP